MIHKNIGNRKLVINLPREEYSKIKTFAENNFRSLTSVGRLALREFLKNKGDKNAV